ncbi:unnamed protein product [Spirodela intermedia]|uniref:Photosystem II protein I n=1 Tax=Spirodela intermedia TaxID=51605 RepID=A0ABN7E875_SPIIN|nr:unnamed protein product [Spirodela intermedia]
MKDFNSVLCHCFFSFPFSKKFGKKKNKS